MPFHYQVRPEVTNEVLLKAFGPLADFHQAKILIQFIVLKHPQYIESTHATSLISILFQSFLGDLRSNQPSADLLAIIQTLESMWVEKIEQITSELYGPEVWSQVHKVQALWTQNSRYIMTMSPDVVQTILSIIPDNNYCKEFCRWLKHPLMVEDAHAFAFLYISFSSFLLDLTHASASSVNSRPYLDFKNRFLTEMETIVTTLYSQSAWDFRGHLTVLIPPAHVPYLFS